MAKKLKQQPRVKNESKVKKSQEGIILGLKKQTFSSYSSLCNALGIKPAPKAGKEQQLELIRKYYIVETKKDYRCSIAPIVQNELEDIQEYVYLNKDSTPVIVKKGAGKLNFHDYVYYILTHVAISEDVDEQTGQTIIRMGYDYAKTSQDILCAIFYRTVLVQELLLKDSNWPTEYQYDSIIIFQNIVINGLYDEIFKKEKNYQRNKDRFKFRRIYHYGKIVRDEEGKTKHVKTDLTDNNFFDYDVSTPLEKKSRAYQYQLEAAESLGYSENNMFGIFRSPSKTSEMFHQQNQLLFNDDLYISFREVTLQTLSEFDLSFELAPDDYTTRNLKFLKILTEFFIYFRNEAKNKIKRYRRTVSKTLKGSKEDREYLVRCCDEAISMVDRYCVPTVCSDYAKESQKEFFEQYLFEDNSFKFYTLDDYENYKELQECYETYMQLVKDGVDTEEDMLDDIPITAFAPILDSSGMIFPGYKRYDYNWNKLRYFTREDYNKLIEDIQEVDRIFALTNGALANEEIVQE